MFRRILIANRGEIAVRIIHAARELGVETVAVHSAVDHDALHVRRADQAVSLPGNELADTYLSIPALLEAARSTGCDALHPGYGFLSENPLLAEACVEAGITLVGPDAEAIRRMGNKLVARRMAQELGVPVNAGTSGDSETLLAEAASLEFPLLVKAAAGGGGKGMRIVEKLADLEEAVTATAREAAAYFGDGTVYVERYIENPRHVEVQVMGDHHGNYLHFGERECTIQRRYQKIIEEAPSPTLDAARRAELGEAALKLCRAIQYRNAGTVEFILAPDGRFYFLEMNTRIQVEHPVTEMVSGIDLVQWQIRVAAGEKLPFRQEDIRLSGHAIECRIYAENPATGFTPSPGTMTLFTPPDGPGVRTDSGFDGPGTVQSFYDPMIAKLVVHATTRDDARRKAVRCLEEFGIHGIHNNLAYLRQIITHPDFVANRISTGFCSVEAGRLDELMTTHREGVDPDVVLAAVLLAGSARTGSTGERIQEHDVWQQIGGWRIG